MGVDNSREEYWRKARERHARLNPPDSEPPLNGGNGGGTSGGGMESRVAKLEADMEHVKKGVDRVESGVTEIRKTLADIRVDASNAHGELKAGLATIEERTKHFPTRWDVFLIFCAVATALAAIIGLAVRYIPHAP